MHAGEGLLPSRLLARSPLSPSSQWPGGPGLSSASPPRLFTRCARSAAAWAGRRLRPGTRATPIPAPPRPHRRLRAPTPRPRLAACARRADKWLVRHVRSVGLRRSSTCLGASPFSALLTVRPPPMEEEQTYLELYLDQCVAQVSPEAAAAVPGPKRVPARLLSAPSPER